MGETGAAGQRADVRDARPPTCQSGALLQGGKAARISSAGKLIPTA